MKKIAALLCLLLMSAPGCAGKFPADIWPALKACGTNDVSWAAATEVFADLVEIVNGNPAGEADLLTMLASDVGGAIPCLVNYFQTQGGAVGAAAAKFKTGHAREMKAAEARGPSACRSPGDSAPPVGPTLDKISENTGHGAGQGDDQSPHAHALAPDRHPRQDVNLGTSSMPFPGSAPGTAPQRGPAALSAMSCDLSCGKPMSGLVTPSGCSCQRKVAGKLRWVPLATVAAR